MIQEYQIRYAAGVYWITKMNQIEASYIPPIVVNECGAMLWDGIAAGMNLTQLAELLVREYGINQEHAMQDASDFLEQLKRKGIV